MAVKEKMQEIRNLLSDANVDRTIRARSIVINAALDQLEVKIVIALQVARQTGYAAGYKKALHLCNLPDKT